MGWSSSKVAQLRPRFRGILPDLAQVRPTLAENGQTRSTSPQHCSKPRMRPKTAESQQKLAEIGHGHHPTTARSLERPQWLGAIKIRMNSRKQGGSAFPTNIELLPRSLWKAALVNHPCGTEARRNFFACKSSFSRIGMEFCQDCSKLAASDRSRSFGANSGPHSLKLPAKSTERGQCTTLLSKRSGVILVPLPWAAQISPKSRSFAEIAQFRRNRARLGRVRAQVGRFWATLVGFGRCRAKFGLIRAISGRCRANVGRCRGNFGRARANSERCWPSSDKFGRCRKNVGPFRTSLGRHESKSCQIWS